MHIASPGLLQAPLLRQPTSPPILVAARLFYCGGGAVQSKKRPMDDGQNTSPRSNLWWIFAALWFGIWHYLHTWQTWLDPLRRVPGPIGDNTVMLWNLGWVRHALNHGNPGFWFANAYYPDGFLFLYGTHTWLDGVLGWLMSPVLPAGIGASILWANITMAIATISSGLLVIAALRAWGIRTWPILLLVASGVVFSWFRRFALMGHYHFYGTQWMLLSLVLASYGRNAAMEGRVKQYRNYFICAGLALGVTFLNDQTMAVFAGIVGALILIGTFFVVQADMRLKSTAAATTCFYGMALISASVHLVPILVAISDHSFKYKVSLDTPRLVDATSFVLPPDIHWLGQFLEGVREKHGLTWSEGTYLGIVPMLLLGLMTIYAVRYLISKPSDRPREIRLCFYAALCAWTFLLVGLGDSLMIGREIYNPMPGRILRSIPIINNIRMPQRWVWPAHLCIALGGASVLAMLIQRQDRKWLQWFACLLAVIPPLEAIRYPATAPVDFRNDPFLRPPGLIEKVQDTYKSGGVLLMPAEIAYAHSNVFQFQWGYDIPVTVAYTARMPFNIQELPWKGRTWSPAAAVWLKEKDVTMIVFSFHDGDVPEYQPWISEAKKAVPGLVILNRFGEEI